MKRELFPVGRESCTEAGGVLARAFRDDPVTCAVLRDLPSEQRVDRLTPAFTIGLESSLARSWALGVVEGQRIVGVALNHPPGAHPLPFTAETRKIFKIVRRSGIYGLGRWLRWLHGIGRAHPRTPHYYLEAIGVEPDFQGQGVGSLLLRALTARADTERLACFLETANPANLSLYRRFDFQIVAQTDIIGVHTWFMRREPRNP